MIKTLANKLVEYREKAGYEFAYSIYKEYGILRDALIKYEKGIKKPSTTEILALAYIYKLTKKETKELLELLND